MLKIMEVNSDCKQENEDKFCGPIFVPQLFLQRYNFVADVLNKHKIKSVVDLGCAECGISRFLKEVESLESISLVDIDTVTLDSNKFRIKPFTYDYLHKRKKPLTVKIYEGSATEIDSCIIGCEAVTMVEFIEHLVKEDLEKVILAVFRTLNPKLVVMTTPNYEFNQLFPSYPSFRHYDHKFEWTRNEFQKWCNDICNTYGYSVNFEGIGMGPAGSENLGCCTQAAIFSNQNTPTYKSSLVKSSCYKLIAESIFPHKIGEELSQNCRLGMEIDYYSRILMQDPDLADDNDEEVVIPLQRLLKFRQISELCDEQKLREYLKLENYKLTSDENSIILPMDREDNWREEYFGDFDEDNVESEISKDSEPLENTYYEEEESWD